MERNCLVNPVFPGSLPVLALSQAEARGSPGSSCLGVGIKG